MAEAAPARPQTRFASGDVAVRLQQVLALLFPSNLAAKAALFAVVVALLPLLPSSQEPRFWELPHLLLLGIIISYGVFGQKNADAEGTAFVAASKPVDDEPSVEAYVSQMMQGSLVFEGNDRDGADDGDGANNNKDGVQTWSSQYLPDDPLVVVADTGRGKGDAAEKPLLLPVRKLKPAADESATLARGISDEGIEEEGGGGGEELIGAKAEYNGVRDHAIPSPSSVLDADLTLSPCSPPLLPPPPPPPPFLGHGRSLRKAKARSFNDFGVGNRSMNGRLSLHGMGNKQFRSKSAVQATRSAFVGYDPAVSIDDEADDDAEFDEMAAASDSSFSSDDVVTDVDDDNANEGNSCEEDEDDSNSCDEVLFELATRPDPEEEEEEEEVGDEVDRKADEFIAKFREQIRMQRAQPARR